MKNTKATHQVIVGGSKAAQLRWRSGSTYCSASAALRRARQIRKARDLGVATVWVTVA